MIRICGYVRIRARYVGQNLGANVLHSAFTGLHVATRAVSRVSRPV